MAISPLTATAGHNPFTDLLFSPRAAFIWDHTRRAVTWMNAAARSKFDIGPLELGTCLPASLIRRFSQCLDGTEGKRNAPRTARLKIARHPALDCLLEILELADGHEGLIVAEAGDAQTAAVVATLTAPRRKPAAKAARKRRTVLEPQRKPSAPQLTAEELRSFEAIGRKVRRLAEEKRRAGPKPPEVSASVSPFQQKAASAGAQAAPSFLLSAFDLVLFLDENFDIVGCEGRPQRFGWRKSSLQGRPAAELLLAGEQTVFQRIAKKLDASAAPMCRDALAVCDGTGSGVPCRAILGRWREGNAQYFLALMSLALPVRLKRMQPQALVFPHIAQLAA